MRVSRPYGELRIGLSRFVALMSSPLAFRAPDGNATEAASPAASVRIAT
jgi:hypothetical protein